MPLIKTRDGTDIYLKEWGGSAGQPAILIHGWPLNADSFDRLAMHLGEAGHRVILKAFANAQETPGVPGLELPGMDFIALATGYGCSGDRVATEIPITAAVAPLL